MMEKHLAWYGRLRRERLARGWSQADVARSIRCSVKTVNRWEQGKTFPEPYHRQQLVKLYNKSTEELGLLFEQGDAAVEAHDYPLPALQVARREDWGTAPGSVTVYGREQECASVRQWIEHEHCRVIALVGIGGIGKTLFTAMLARQMGKRFSHVFWRSLQHMPPLVTILENYLQFVSPQRRVELPRNPDDQIALFIQALQEQPCLLVLDNMESVFEPGQSAGQYKEGYEGYGRLIRAVGEARHRSCLLLTSREKPREIAHMQGNLSPVRVLPLSGIDYADGQKLLQDKDLRASDETWAAFVRLYSGNPLALKLVAEPIREVFGGDIAAFLQEGESVLEDIEAILEEQFERLSTLEQSILYWLAIEREALNVNEIRANIVQPLPRGTFITALESLRRRSLLEVSNDNRFTLQSVIMEYVTERLVARVVAEIASETIDLLGSHALLKAEGKDYIKESEIRLIVAPIAARLLTSHGRDGCVRRLQSLLAKLRLLQSPITAYAAGNVLNLLNYLAVDLRGYDFSHLAIRQADLQAVTLHSTNFTHANFAASTFTNTFTSVLCIALSRDGSLLAIGTTTGEVRLLHAESLSLLYSCMGHRDGVRSVAFNADGTLLASGSEDQAIRLWDCKTGHCLATLHGHESLVRSVAFNDEGRLLASGSEDLTVRIWDMSTGKCLHTLREHAGWVRCVAFHPTNNMLASSSADQTIRLWDANTGACLRVLRGHSAQVRPIAFSLDGQLLASGSEDRTIRIWDSSTGRCQHVLRGHSDLVRSLVFADHEMLASGSEDGEIILWDRQGDRVKTLYGHSNRVWSLAFSPRSATLVSGSEDDTLRIWDIPGGQCTRILRAFASLIKAIAYSPDGRMLVSGSEDGMLRLWESTTGQNNHSIKMLRGHGNRVRSVAFSPDGTLIASGSEDETVRIWDSRTAACIATLRGHTHLVRSVAFTPDGRQVVSASHDETIRIWQLGGEHFSRTLRGGSLFWSIAVSPDGKTIASGSEDSAICLWDLTGGTCLKVLYGHTHRVWSLAFSPGGNLLASASDDQTVRIWDTVMGVCLHRMPGHSSWVRTIAFSPDGRMVASGSHDQTIRTWDALTGQAMGIIHGHSDSVWNVTFSPDGSTIASCSDDGTIKLWDVATGACVNTLRDERPYEGMNISGATGLSPAQKTSLKALGAIEE